MARVNAAPGPMDHFAAWSAWLEAVPEDERAEMADAITRCDPSSPTGVLALEMQLFSFFVKGWIDPNGLNALRGLLKDILQTLYLDLRMNGLEEAAPQAATRLTVQLAAEARAHLPPPATYTKSIGEVIEAAPEPLQAPDPVPQIEDRHGED